MREVTVSNDLKELRRSSVVSGFGPGAVIDFRAGNAPVSGVACGLEEWDNSFPPMGMSNPQRTHEERLQKKLRVLGFRLPPLVNDHKDNPDNRRLVAVRFPSWLQCPNCDFIKPERRWSADSGEAYRFCGPCTARNPGGHKVFVIPVRFVLACERGHLDEFPWDYWVNHAPACDNRNRELLLKSVGPGLAGLILSCPSCKVRKSMDGIFSKSTWERLGKCRGRRPWLASNPESCERFPVAVQRGASNLYFPVIESALSIPPWTDKLQDALGTWWSSLAAIADPEQRKQYISLTQDLQQALDSLGMTPEKLAYAVERRIDQYHKMDTDDLRPAEYRQFIEEQGENETRDKDFEVRRESVPQEFDSWLSTIVRVVRLREVRALTGFTRINPPGDVESIAPLSVSSLPWLPAIEVRGEGIFLSLAEERVHEWECRPSVVARAKECDRKFREDWRARSGKNSEPELTITARYILCHTFAHALMRQLSLECGYSTASLQERIFAAAGNIRMAGLLIYTATSDSDGTLGGLQRQGQESRLKGIVERAIRSLQWCSSDPLCITDSMGAISSYSHSACHACVLCPETSCENFNKFLDRAYLVGLPNDPSMGYFNEMIAQ